MFKFLFVIFFFFILLVFLMGFSVLRTFKRIFFGSGSSSNSTGQHRRAANSGNTANDAYQDESQRNQQRKKIFAKDEGEYVDYEEVK